MCSLAQFADPLDGFLAEKSLGYRRPIMTIVPDAPDCEHIAALLRKGCTNGRGIVDWDLRTAPGVRFPQDRLDAIADRVEDGRLYDNDPCWRIDVREP